MLELLQKPFDDMDRFAIRFAANSLAHDASSGAKSKSRFEQGLRYAELGARWDSDYDEEHAPVIATQVELLLALGREEEAYPIVARVLERKPGYRHFQALKKSAPFRRWQSRHTTGVAGSFTAIVGPELATPLNCAMLAKVQTLNENQKRAPLTRETIERMRLPKTRGEKTSSLPLPPSLKALLAYDSKFRIRGKPFFGKSFTSTTLAPIFAESTFESAYRHLDAAGEADLPALIELPLGTDQRVFLYPAKANSDGEYPILRWSDEPALWLASACLQDAICADAALPGIEERMRAAKRAVAKWLKQEPAP